MKKEIHPKYQTVTAKCACGETFEVGSTSDTIRVDICSACHPLFTGKQKLLDIEGRVNKFQKKYATAKKPSTKKKKVVRRKKKSISK